MSHRLEQAGDFAARRAPESIRDAAAQAWDPRQVEQSRAGKSKDESAQFLDCPPLNLDHTDLPMKSSRAGGVLKCESSLPADTSTGKSDATQTTDTTSTPTDASSHKTVGETANGEPINVVYSQSGDGANADFVVDSQGNLRLGQNFGQDNGQVTINAQVDAQNQVSPDEQKTLDGLTKLLQTWSPGSDTGSGAQTPAAGATDSPASGSTNSSQPTSADCPPSSSSGGSDSGSSGGSDSGSSGGSDSGSSGGSDSGSSDSGGSDTGNSSSSMTPDQFMQAIMAAFEQAMQESGGDPQLFLQDFLKDLNAALGQSGSGAGSDTGGGGGSDTGTTPAGSDSGSTTPGGSDSGSAGGGGGTQTGIASLLNFSGDPNASNQLRQQLTQELQNLPTDVQNKLLQQGTQINVVPESQLGSAAGLYDTGSNVITIGDGSGAEKEALAHEVAHALDVGPNGQNVTGSAGFQNALNKDLSNGLPGDFNQYSWMLADAPTSQYGFGEGDLYAEIAAGLLGQDQTGIPQQIANDFPRTTAYVAQQLGLPDNVA
jgi:hypothetical protein